MFKYVIPMLFWPLSTFTPNPLYIWIDSVFLIGSIGGLWLFFIYLFPRADKKRLRVILYSATISIMSSAVLFSIGLSRLNRCDTSYLQLFLTVAFVSLIGLLINSTTVRVIAVKRVSLSNISLLFSVILSTLFILCLQLFMGSLYIKGCGYGIGWDLL